MNWYGGYGQWEPYVSVAQRKARGLAKAKKRLKKGETLSPIEKITQRGISSTFWGQQWCDYMEHYSDFANRLPRGRTLARNGSIADLRINPGEVTSMVCGSDLYQIRIAIGELSKKHWKQICSDCAQSIHSVIDLMRGELSDGIIARLTDPKQGMFPSKQEIRMSCSCPDGASLCKHLAATLYGVGHRLDTSPELLFVLRGVDQADLISESIAVENVDQAIGLQQASSFDSDELGSIFGIDLVTGSGEQEPVSKATKKKAAKKRVKKKRSKKRTVAKQETNAPKKPAKKAVKKKAVKKKSATKKKVAKKAVKRKVVKRKVTPSAQVKPTAKSTRRDAAVAKKPVKRKVKRKVKRG